MAKDRFRKRRFPLNSGAVAIRCHPRKTTGNTVGFRQHLSMQDPFLLSGRVTSRARLFLFHHALQGVLVLACKIHHLRHFGLGDFIGEYAALADTVVMDM